MTRRIAPFFLAIAAGALIAACHATTAPVGTPAPLPPVPSASVAPVAAPPIVPSTPPTTTTTRPTTTAHHTTTTTHRPTTTHRSSSADTSSGCGQRAVTAGKFNPSCSEYQGYLDPGTAAGRAPNSGEIQTQYGCEQGYIPKSEC